MSAPQFTPGPWVVLESTLGGLRSAQIIACEDYVIAELDYDEYEADARLIAAAPELYAALDYARNLIGPDGVLDAALAKARGEQ